MPRTGRENPEDRICEHSHTTWDCYECYLRSVDEEPQEEEVDHD